MTVSAPGLVRPAAAGVGVAEVRRAGLGSTLRRHPRLAVGGGLVLLLVLLALLAPLLTPYNPIVGDASDGNLARGPAHWLGTDDQGRDVLSRVLFGARLSLSVAVIAVLIGVVFGVSIGMVEIGRAS